MVRGNADDVNRAVAAAKAALEPWAALSHAERGAYLMKIHEGLKARADEIARPSPRKWACRSSSRCRSRRARRSRYSSTTPS
ncbi:MAG: aldehyde dehydrogenase family protein [Rhizobacter sp.]|nr:aldehyde dehydrogenase family protein [Rhizobacter sp.]